MAAGGLMGLLHAFFAITLRADQIVGGTAINFLALGLTTYLFLKIYGEQGAPTDLSTIPDVSLGFLDDIPGVGDFLHDVFGRLDLMIWVAHRPRRRVVDRRLQDADRSAAALGGRAPARGGHGRDQRLRDPLRRGDALRHARGARVARTSRSAS